MTTPSSYVPTTSIDPATEVGLLSLTVADLTRSVAFYRDAIGFAVLDRDTAEATLGAGGAPLLLLKEHPDAAPWPRDTQSHTGLYHFAILLPARADLGCWLAHWLELGLSMPGQGDHLVSEALYLEDPDGNGIEIYRDRPRDQWQWNNGQVRMGVDPVDVRGLLSEAERSGEPWNGLAAGTRLGHVHLQVGDIAPAEKFYHDILGFDVIVRMPAALFVSAGGYHHHIGMNTWHSRGAGPAPIGTAGLRFFTINLPSEEARQAVLDRIQSAGLQTRQSGEDIAVQDPWRNTIVLRAGSSSAAPQLD
ncbi:MAG: VOC family protein [Chloroflexota bacterium]